MGGASGWKTGAALSKKASSSPRFSESGSATSGTRNRGQHSRISQTSLGQCESWGRGEESELGVVLGVGTNPFQGVASYVQSEDSLSG